MTEDRAARDGEPGDRPSDEAIEFTDAEYAFLRHARFGELPPRIRPEDRIELVETDPQRQPHEDVDQPPWLNG
jgi:hypothetical protein